MKGIFITIEGNDGSGKTTVIEGISQMLKENGCDFIITREPGGSEVAEKIRSVILDKENSAMDPKTEALLYAASRRQHLVEKVLPALTDGKLVLCDRYLDSSLAYQGYARGIGINEVFQMNQFATEGLLPDLTIYIAVHPSVGLNRKNKQKDLDRLESEKLSFHEAVFTGYEKLVDLYPRRIKRIDGEQVAEKVIGEAVDVVKTFLVEKGLLNNV